MDDLWAVLRFGHLLAAVSMAAPLYALRAVNSGAGSAPPSSTTWIITRRG